MGSRDQSLAGCSRGGAPRSQAHDVVSVAPAARRPADRRHRGDAALEVADERDVLEDRRALGGDHAIEPEARRRVGVLRDDVDVLGTRARRVDPGSSPGQASTPAPRKIVTVSVSAARALRREMWKIACGHSR